MINKITCIEELDAARAMLREKKVRIENAIKRDIYNIEQDLGPAVSEVLHPVKDDDNKIDTVNNLVGISLTLGTDLLVTQVLMKHSSYFKRAIASLVIQTALPMVIANKTRRLISTFFSKRKEED